MCSCTLVEWQSQKLCVTVVLIDSSVVQWFAVRWYRGPCAKLLRRGNNGRFAALWYSGFMWWCSGVEVVGIWSAFVVIAVRVVVE
jgi:hypothetical protein